MSRTRKTWLALAVAFVVAIVSTAIPALAADSPGTVQGKLTDGGNPVANATVAVIDSEFNYAGYGSTDSNGDFQFADIAPGTYRLMFSLDGGYEQWASQKRTAETADLITVIGGETTTINESITPYGSLTGHVYNTDGSPAAYALVEAYQDGPDYAAGAAYADANGAYTMRYLPAGNYRVSFRRDFNSPRQYADNAVTEGAARLIAVTLGSTTALDQTLLATSAIRGTVTSHGAPAANIAVQVNQTDGPAGGSATTAEDGTYSIALLPGTYQVSFQLPNGQYEYAPRQLDPLKAATYTVVAGSDTILNEKLRPTGTVSGRVTWANGDPVQTTGIELSNKWGSVSSYVDENGHWELTALPGTYTLSFASDHGTQWAHGKSTADTADQVTVLADQNLVADEAFAELGTLVVTAEDATSHAPIAEFCADVSFATACTTDGTITFADVLPGRHRTNYYSETPNGFDSSGIVAVVSSGATTTATLSLTRTGSVTTVITDANTGNPVAGACLELINVLGPNGFGTNVGNCSDSTGTVSVAGLRPGSYKAFVWIFDGVHGKQWVGPTGGVGKFKKATTVTLTAGQAFTLPTVKLDKSGTISGTVTDEITGLPVANAIVGLSTFNAGYGGGSGLVSTDSQGHYTQSGLGPYAWTLYFTADHYASEWSGDEAYRDRALGVKVRAHASTTYDLALGQGTVVTGRVFGPDGSRADQARVTFINADTGDEMEAGDVYYSINRYTAYLKGPQRIKLHYYANVRGQRYSGWVGGSDFTAATVVNIRASGTKTINVTVTQTDP